MDIGSNNKYPANALSNFAPHHFIIDGVEVSSMEGFLQSLKFENVDAQKNVCQKVGIKAKGKGRKKKWWVKQTLYWQGVPYPRQSAEYQELITRAYTLLVTQNRKFQRALLAKPGASFTHSIGKNKTNETILTKREFIHQLNRCRELLISGDVQKL